MSTQPAAWVTINAARKYAGYLRESKRFVTSEKLSADALAKIDAEYPGGAPHSQMEVTVTLGK